MATLNAKRSDTETLEIGLQLTVIMNTPGTAVITRSQTGTVQETVSLTAGQTYVFGEYFAAQNFVITCHTGSLTYSKAQVVGQHPQRATQTNDDAAAGVVGEYKTAQVLVASEVTLATATAKTVLSISLTPGDWDVAGAVQFDLAGASTTFWDVSFSSTADTLGTANNMPLILTTTTAILAKMAPLTRFTLSATTTIYLVAKATFSAGTVKAYGDIRARRVR